MNAPAPPAAPHKPEGPPRIPGQRAVRPKNAATVMVTAKLPPFATTGTQIDVTVSAMCDSQSLEGGTLLVTPLQGAGGDVYAVPPVVAVIPAYIPGGASMVTALLTVNGP